MKKPCRPMILKYLKDYKAFSLFLVLVLLCQALTFAQPKVIDQVIAVVGGNIVLKSELENQLHQVKSQEIPNGSPEVDRCELLEEILFQKLLLNQAVLDSIVISDSQVESEMDRRLRYFIQQIGSEKKLEEYYGKSLSAIKEEFRKLIKDQLLVQQVQSSITSKTTITPSEVKAFFNRIPKDSIPLVSSEIEVAQIVAQPKISEEAKAEAKEKIQAIRERVIKGEKFSTLAVLYSEDPGSSKKGGELGFVDRGSFVPEFEAVAFKLKEGAVSPVIETQYGFHFMELIERRGEQINIRHILIAPKISNEDLRIARNFLDSIRTLILNIDTLDFAEAAALYSDDKETKFNGGLLLNPQTGTTSFEADQLEPSLFFTIDKLKIGEISNPVLMQIPGGKQAYRLLYLKKRTEPHKANLKEDYQKIQEAALNEKKQQVVQVWIDKKLANTYFKLNDEYKSCNFESFKQKTQ
ncbi:MAG: peptidylprolyl isomerase [Bacteroidetes bacterium]|nr:peptidylprolyl isomerase [Bacteroidota bacterium]HET6244930.1 peptidylprolyl isomerase [Bacteroidia bacterium]